MFDQTFGANPYGMQGGYQFNGMQNGQMPKIPNVLNAEEIKELQQQRSQFSLGLTKKESLQAACNHRTADGMQDTLVYDNVTGIATCTICGYQFRPVEAEATYETIKEASDRLVDILQTIKIMYTDLPAEAAKEYFQIIPLIGKVPQLFEFAAKNFAKHEYNGWSYNNHNMGGIAMLQNLSSMFGGGMQPNFVQQPQFNGYAMNPQQPVGYPNGMAPQMPGQNPFGYPGASTPMMGMPQMGAPVQQPVAGGYAPQTQGYAYQPNVAAPAAPDAPAVTDDTVKQNVTV